MGAPALAVVSVASTGLSIYARQQSAKANATVAAHNAELARMQGTSVMHAGTVAAGDVKTEGRRVSARALAAVGGNAIDSTVGSAAGLIAEPEALSEVDASKIRQQAALAAWGFESEAADTLTQSEIRKRESLMGSAAIGLGGASRAYSAYKGR